MRTRLITRTTAAVALAGAMTLGLAACGGDDEDTAAAPPPVADVPATEAEPVAALTDLTGEMTEVILEPSFLEGLTSLKLEPGVVGKAKLDADTGTLSFPISGGSATYYEPGSRDPYVESSIEHNNSGISLTDGETVVELTNFVVDAGASMLMGDVAADGETVVEDAPLFFLDGTDLEPLDINQAGTKAVLFGTVVSLTDAAADLLNMTYGTDVLTEFFTVGTARITLALPAS